jgi:hypothetical protein
VDTAFRELPILANASVNKGSSPDFEKIPRLFTQEFQIDGTGRGPVSLSHRKL